jgi:hypothetical protein
MPGGPETAPSTAICELARSNHNFPNMPYLLSLGIFQGFDITRDIHPCQAMNCSGILLMKNKVMPIFEIDKNIVGVTWQAFKVG